MRTITPFNETPYFPREGDARGFALGYDIFWPGDAAEDHTKIEKPGNYIGILNNFLPGIGFESAAVYYSLSLQEGLSIGVSATPFNMGKVIPVQAGMQAFVRDGFSHLYRTRTITTFDITNTSQFTFTYLKYYSTPIVAAIGQDFVNTVPSKTFDNSFRYVASSSIPTTLGSATIDCRHGFADIVQVGVAITTAANAIQIQIVQYDEFSNAHEEFNVFPAAFPYYNLFSLPQKDSVRARVAIIGGGGGETGTISITYILRPRV